MSWNTLAWFDVKRTRLWQGVIIAACVALVVVYLLF